MAARTKLSWRQRLRQTFYVWHRLLPYIAAFKLRLVLALLFTLIVVGAELAKPWPLQLIVDAVVGGKKSKTLWLVPSWLSGPQNAPTLALLCGAAVLVLSLISGLATYFRDLWLADAGQRVVNKVRRHALERMLLMSMAWQERHRRGDLLLRLVGDAASLRMLLIEGLFSLMREGLLLIGTLVVMFWMDWQLALLSIAVMPAIAVMTTIFGVRLRRAARQQRQKEGELATSVHETLSAIPVIQSYGLEEEATATFNKANRKSAKAGLTATRLEGRLGIGADTAMALGLGLVMYFGALRAITPGSSLSVGGLLTMLNYVRSFYKPIRKGMSRSAAMVKASAAGERMLHLLDAVPDLPAPATPRVLSAVRGEIELRGVTFGHADGRQVLRDANLHIPAGQHIALVGANGSGKTTLATLLPRLRDPGAGSVRLDGVDVRELDLAQLRRSIAVVFQETILFDGTLRDNILLGRPEARSKDVEAAAECAGVTGYSARWSEGLETRVGERGAGLSGGERQRVALARALVRNAAVVVLDEPTTGLDAAAEERLCTEVLTRLRSSTVLLITHNPRVLASVDRIVRIVDGQLFDVDRDTGAALLSTGTKEQR